MSIDNVIAHRPCDRPQFVGKTGALYVVNPTDHFRYTRYDSVEDYNTRTRNWELVDKAVAHADFEREVEIDSKTLTIGT